MFDLSQCIGDCKSCIHAYSDKHSLKKGDKFKISCTGIPTEFVPESVLSLMPGDPNLIVGTQDPVTWAATMLDWHCIDPKGEHWKRKHEQGTLGGAPEYKEFQAKAGCSIFHRPYQEIMLRCSSKYKVFRLGRQLGKTETLCIAILHALFTNGNFQATIIAPYQSQIDLIFKRVQELIRSNPILQNSVVRNVKAPQYTIELKNGSMAIGFTAGTRSGGDAASVRGQRGGMLVFDEADYLSPADIDATLSVITNFPDATVWMSSTPTGKREKFYETCHARDWREFHLPSHSNPNWTEQLDDFFKNILTEDGYDHEIKAIFGEQEEGVYQAKYVEAAQDEYEYGDCVRQKPTGDPNKDYLYTIGVDWNDPAIGVAIAVVEWNPFDRLFRIVDKQIIAKSEYTQIKGCQKVVELNRIWTPVAIYADAGHGSTSAEILKLAGHNAIRRDGRNSPDAAFTRIFKKYQFGGNIETRDPFTKQPVKKQGKAFLVENSVRRFEQSIIKYPRSDEKYTAALHGYIVKNISQAGVPVYHEENKTAGDHFLDAVNLALVAFMLEKTEFGNPHFSTDIAQTGPLGLSEALPSDKQPGDRTSEISSVNPVAGQLPPSRRMPGRTNRIIEEQPSMPGANLQVDKTGLRLWAWPGFERDQAAPAVRTRREAFRQAGERTGNTPRRRSPTPPRRKKF